VVRGEEEPAGSSSREVLVPIEEPINLVLVLLAFQRTRDVYQHAARSDSLDHPFEQIALPSHHPCNVTLGEPPSAVGVSRERASGRARGIDQDHVKRVRVDGWKTGIGDHDRDMGRGSRKGCTQAREPVVPIVGGQDLRGAAQYRGFAPRG
jgi:hypothetical protein